MIRYLTRTALVASILLGIAAPALAQPAGSTPPITVDRRSPPPAPTPAIVYPVPQVVAGQVAYPASAPPAPRAENHRRGGRNMVWINGHWDWNNGGWTWTAGRWQRDQPTRRWRPGEWQQRDQRWQWRPDAWEDVPAHPTAPPPALQVENPGRGRGGMIWVEGRWAWQRGEWAWVAGRWQRPRAGLELRSGEWRQGPDHWEWRAEAWIDPEHDQPRGTAASRGAAPRFAPPPARQEPAAPARVGYVWASGRYRWTGSNYEWIDGQWKRQQAERVWLDGRWQRQGKRYAWREGRWETPARRLR